MSDDRAARTEPPPFPTAGYDDWRADMAATLGDRAYEDVWLRPDVDGTLLEPLYTAENADVGLDVAAGGWSFARAARPLGNAEGGWRVAQVYDLTDPAAARAAIVEDLAGGVTELWLRLPELVASDHGEDTDAERLHRALDGVDLAWVHVAIDEGRREGAVGAGGRALLRLIESGQVALDTSRVDLGLDIFGSLAAYGATDQQDTADRQPTRESIGRELERHAATIRPLFDGGAPGEPPRIYRIELSPWHEAGATRPQLLGILLSTALTYARALVENGMSMADVARATSFVLPVETAVIHDVALLRAARTAWARLLAAAGAPAAAAHMRITAAASRRIWTRRDPMTNLLRGTLAGVGGAFGGADAILLWPFDAARRPANAFGRRLARNTQRILLEESSLNRVVDPLGGAYAVEHLTETLARAGWAEMQRIEAEGGMFGALRSGALLARIADSAAARERSIRRRRRPITGVSSFANAEERRDAAAHANLSPFLTTGDAAPWERLRDAADAHALATGRPPLAYLARLGNPAAPAATQARVTWAQNLLEAGGFAVEAGEPVPTAPTMAADLAADFAATGATVALLAASDADYADHAAPAATALREAGAKSVVLAGKPGAHEDTWRAAGVADFAYVGADVCTVLEGMQAAAGVDPNAPNDAVAPDAETRS